VAAGHLTRNPSPSYLADADKLGLVKIAMLSSLITVKSVDALPGRLKAVD